MTDGRVYGRGARSNGELCCSHQGVTRCAEIVNDDHGFHEVNRAQARNIVERLGWFWEEGLDDFGLKTFFLKLQKNLFFSQILKFFFQKFYNYFFRN